MPGEQSLEGQCQGILEGVLEMVNHLLGEANPQCHPHLCHVLCDGHTMAQCSLCHVSQSMSHCLVSMTAYQVECLSFSEPGTFSLFPVSWFLSHYGGRRQVFQTSRLNENGKLLSSPGITGMSCHSWLRKRSED